MSAELERHLRASFGRLPKPGRDATARARASALSALGPSKEWRPRGLLVLALVVIFGVGAGAVLAATGKLHVDIGTRQPAPAPVLSRLKVPAGTHGLAVVAAGRLWLSTRSGLRIEGLPATTAELSPRALYAVVGVGTSLVAFAPGQRRAWTHAATGPVLAASWSPDGLKIAYVTRTKARMQLRLIEGDGDNDRLLDTGVSASRPGWRGDSLAILYRTAGARSAVFDLFHNRRMLGKPSPPAAPRRAHARSPRGNQTAVAVALPHRVLEVRLLPLPGVTGPGEVLLRVRAAASPVVISWR